MSEKTLKELLRELIDSLDYFRLLTDNQSILETLQSINKKVDIIIQILRDKQ